MSTVFLNFNVLGKLGVLFLTFLRYIIVQQSGHKFVILSEPSNIRSSSTNGSVHRIANIAIQALRAKERIELSNNKTHNITHLISQV